MILIFKKSGRLIQLQPKSTEVIRAWQGHKIEAKWFWIIRGSFSVKLINVEDWQMLPSAKSIKTVKLDTANPQVLHIPGGYFDGFRALEPESILMVYSDTTLSVSVSDDYRFSFEQIPWQ